jgi:ornithine decarboxylase
VIQSSFYKSIVRICKNLIIDKFEYTKRVNMRKEQYKFPVEDFISKDDFNKIKKVSRDKKIPFLIINLRKIEQSYEELLESMPFAKIHYAVKVNPMDEVVLTLKNKGSNFDVVSVYEFDQVLRLGVEPERISYGNTIKKE